MADLAGPSLERIRPSRLPTKPEYDLAGLNSGKPWPARRCELGACTWRVIGAMLPGPRLRESAS